MDTDIILTDLEVFRRLMRKKEMDALVPRPISLSKPHKKFQALVRYVLKQSVGHFTAESFEASLSALSQFPKLTDLDCRNLLNNIPLSLAEVYSCIDHIEDKLTDSEASALFDMLLEANPRVQQKIEEMKTEMEEEEEEEDEEEMKE
ncbi:hypothetical protein ADUPG1_008449 [Aduncisulcus paluster]|uniref:DNA-directed RNA polymerase III subunit RPC9 n=1 Tax=Aduncisulcus paluster TaxID=2918883 RepID=A0ABQ5KS13_9EUKA|nr:hypothetical protein ADUPG1_008449 [Aduncisulcus paluster]